MRTLMALTAAAVLASPLAAQGWIEPLPDRPIGFGIVKERTVVSVRVAGRIAAVTVEEWFRNSGRGLGEGDYLYPLPGEAVFSNFSLFQGDQELRGETMDAKAARAIYEEIVRRKRDPALIELAGHGLIRARVFPINAGETRKITLRYTQILERAGDALQFRYSAGGRNGSWGRGVEGGTAHAHIPEPAPLTFTLVADSGDVFGDPFSPTHGVRVSREDGRLTVRPDAGARHAGATHASPLRGDFVLFLPLARGLVGVTVATHAPSGENGYFMLTLSPRATTEGTLPRDLTVVLDVSGSMSGSKLEQGKAALRQLLNSLGPTDRFRLLSFSNRVTAHGPTWSRVGRRELRNARGWIDGLQANGGTNIAGALEEAFRLSSPDDRLPIVVFLTDGLPSVGERDPERIAAQAEADRDRARVFAFGVGHDVNTYLLGRLSAAGRGATEYVQPGEDVEQALSALAAKIQHPVLTDLAIADSPVELTDVYPTTLPDLFVGEELVVFGRYRSSGRTRAGAVADTGRRAGRTERFATRAEFAEHALANDFIPRLWASRKIGELSRIIRLEGHNAELERAITETALRYGLLSEYTSYLVQEPLEVADLPAGAVAGTGATTRRSTAIPMMAPANAVGAGAVAAAEQSRARRETKSFADLRSADEDLLERRHGPQARHVAGRLFIEKDGVWTDLRHADSLNTIDVEPYSDAYFALLDRMPELKPYFTEFERILIAGERTSIRITQGGARTMSPYRLSRVVREFRGR